MATKKPPTERLLDRIEQSLRKELDNLDDGSDPDTQKPYTLTDKTKVWDRILKLEAIKAKLNEGEWGAGFADN